MPEFAARLVAVFGRSLSSSVLVVFGYLVWFALRGVPCAPDSIVGLCTPAMRLGEIVYSKQALVSLFGISIGLLGVGYLAGLLHDAVYDSNLRANYDSLLASFFRIRTHSDRELAAKRAEAVQILTNAPAAISPATVNDYLLYEIIGGMISTSTRHYVDEARIVGITILTAIGICWLDFLVHDHEPHPAWLLAVMAAASLFLFVIGREAVKAQYRYRAIRLYVNLVLLEQGRMAP
jgi:hypothetical protein